MLVKAVEISLLRDLMDSLELLDLAEEERKIHQ
jgi:hypothetical protein